MSAGTEALYADAACVGVVACAGAVGAGAVCAVVVTGDGAVSAIM